VEGRKILSTGDSLQIIYTADISDPNQFDALFIRALAMRIATNIAYSLAPNKTWSRTLRPVRIGGNRGPPDRGHRVRLEDADGGA
jgi:hypothetical protein